MGRVTFVLTKHNPLIKHVKCVVLCQSVLLAVLGLKVHDVIIKWIRFGLSHLTEYPCLNMTRTRHNNPN